jgi:hypothetical protein
MSTYLRARRVTVEAREIRDTIAACVWLGALGLLTLILSVML